MYCLFFRQVHRQTTCIAGCDLIYFYSALKCERSAQGVVAQFRSDMLFLFVTCLLLLFLC